MRPAFRLALLAVVVSMVGCRFKGYEAFVGATTPRPDLEQYPKKGETFGDNGLADSSGGLSPQTRYGVGANPDGKPLPGYDQPQKGSGQERNEYPNVASAGHAQTNAPSFQPTPSDVGNPR